MNDISPDFDGLSVEEKAALVDDLRRRLAAAQSEIRLLRRRLGEKSASGDPPEAKLRDKLHAAAPHVQREVPQGSMKFGRRLRSRKSPVLTGLIAFVGIALILDAGVGWYQARSLEAQLRTRLQLESSILTSLYVELKTITYEADGRSYRMTVLVQNNNPAVPLFVMLNPVAIYVQTGMTWQQVPSNPADGVRWGVVKVVDSFSYDVLFTPEVDNWAELIPGYMHVRIESDVLVSQRAQPGDDVVERRTPFYVYLKPHGANDDDIRKRSRTSGVPPIFIPMPPH